MDTYLMLIFDGPDPGTCTPDECAAWHDEAVAAWHATRGPVSADERERVSVRLDELRLHGQAARRRASENRN